jgi:hypothetical protein
MERRQAPMRGGSMYCRVLRSELLTFRSKRGVSTQESQGSRREMDRSRMPRPRAVLGEFPYRRRPASGRQPGRSSSCGSPPKPRIESKNAAAATNESSQLVVRRGSNFLQAAAAITTALTPPASQQMLWVDELALKDRRWEHIDYMVVMGRRHA